MTIDEALIKELESIQEPGVLLGALDKKFPKRMAIGTSGQLSGSALIELAVQAGVKPRVFTNDTLRLFPETYALFDAVEKRYGLKIERFVPPEKELKRMVEQHGEYLFFDSKDKQEYCCYVRKVLPNALALNSLDVWVTGLRRDQSGSRAQVSRFEIIRHEQDGKTRPILKVAPLAEWDEARVRAYLSEHQVPVHSLLEKKLPGGWYYESLGCVICTTPIAPDEPRRAGRWRWFNAHDDKKECGLHLPDQAPEPPAG
jgi:phosphoadenosine phosphosulfate reductase